MRFKLYEAPAREWPPSSKTLDAYYNLKSQEQELNFLKEYILPQEKFRRLFGIRPIIIESILLYGLNPEKNPFLKFVTKIPFEMPDARTYKSKMRYIYDGFKNKTIDIKMPVLLKPSLYNRSDKEFKYTLNAFNLFSNPNKAKIYIKDTSVVNIDEFLDENGNVKPGGLDGREGDTIYNTIERWAKDNEYSAEEIANNKSKEDKKDKTDSTPETGYAIPDVIKAQKDWNYNSFKSLVDRAFDDAERYKPALDYEEYLFKLFTIFRYPDIIKNADNYISKSNMVIDSVKSLSQINDALIKANTKEDPAKFDIEIPVTVNDGKQHYSGIYAFHKFISLEDLNALKNVSEENTRIFKTKEFIEDPKKQSSVIKGILKTLEVMQ